MARYYRRKKRYRSSAYGVVMLFILSVALAAIVWVYFFISPITVVILALFSIHIFSKIISYLWGKTEDGKILILWMISTFFAWFILFGLPYVDEFWSQGEVFTIYQKEVLYYVNNLTAKIFRLLPHSFQLKVSLEWVLNYVWCIPLWAMVLWFRQRRKKRVPAIDMTPYTPVYGSKTQPDSQGSAQIDSDYLGLKSYEKIAADGYVVLSDQSLEHRNIAENFLGRALKHYEIVHHINGDRADNSLENLCVMSRIKHEHFHSWLRWKKEKTGKYPGIKSQKRTLQKQYRGKLLIEI